MGRLAALFRKREPGPDESTVRRVEEKRRSSAAATEKWLSLLREMELNGETAQARYDTYYKAYLQAREQEKRIDLELFNMRQGLSQ